MFQKKNLSLGHILDMLLKFRNFQRKKNKQTKQNRKANKPTKRALVAQQTNEFIGLHVYVVYSIVQQALSPCMVLWLCSPLEISFEFGLSVE